MLEYSPTHVSRARRARYAAADAATQVAAFNKQRQEEYLKNSDRVAALKKEIELRDAQAKLAAFDADPKPDELKPVQLAKTQAEVEVLKAQRAFLEAQAAVLVSKASNP
ncbi:hypothetical protein ASG37_15710 [Sphingomonas sp. Leaf407]|uniref:hypothetical protein n=1 Tax=unclassified Sphingomonas TaxID=196159 RepID=UPI0006F80B90|nr:MULTISPECIES: hypothetical protein [unclassified Sphingomonas]KQN34767.1 hypothetical protein ASE97_14965 [Sphingomonas sp. Leaf42]KQT25320.1 hypothetical protein ASG37_15710 [Sphingomonas sp. Leaf407]